MPEYPDVTVYLEALAPRVLGQPLEGVRLGARSLLRTADPPLRGGHRQAGAALRRLGKRLVFVLEGRAVPRAPPHDRRPAALEAPRRAGARADRPRRLRLPGRDAGAHRGEPEEARLAVSAAGRGGRRARSTAAASRSDGRDARGSSRAALRRENHTLKRALTDPRLFSGIGNAYSDEILHRARLSPVALTSALDDDEIAPALRGHAATCSREWTERLRAEAGERVPREGHRLPRGHGGARPLPAALPGLRLAGAAHRLRRERDQLLPHLPDRGKLLADRSLSRLLKEDWPRSLEEMEETRAATRSRMQGPGQG